MSFLNPSALIALAAVSIPILIHLNTTGLNNGTSPSQTIDATNNYWGSPAGPGSNGNNGTTGSNITTAPPVCKKTMRWPFLKWPLRTRSIRPAAPLPQ